MKSHFFLVAFLGCTFCFSQTNQPLNSFKENKGQVHDQNDKTRHDVLFTGRSAGFNYFLKNNGISYQFVKVISWKQDPLRKKDDVKLLNGEIDSKVPNKVSIYRLDLNWIGANISSKVTTTLEHEGFDNYYYENCPNGIHDVKTFGEVLYKNIYPGIDLNYYSKNDNLKYDYIVHPFADIKKIRIQINGASKTEIMANGELRIETPLGTIIEGKPLVFQDNKQIKAAWVLKNNILSLKVENYDKTKPLVIDPVIRLWGTYYGGSGSENVEVYSNTDQNNNVYLAGGTISFNDIATSGGHQITKNLYTDAYLAKFNSAGVRQWGTFYGGNGDERCMRLCFDNTANVYATGVTNSTGSVIPSASGHQTVAGGGAWLDGFVVKFNSAGTRQWATYYGGSIDDAANACVCDAVNNVYVVGYAASSNNISTPSTYQPANNNTDGYIVKFDPTGVRQWGTYFGGFLTEEIISCSISGNNLYTYGTTASSSSVASAGAHQVNNNGLNDAFLAKFDLTGVFQWGTYYGGESNDLGTACATDPAGNIFITGYTGSNIMTSAIATPGSHQNSWNGQTESFLAKFNSLGVRLWGTYYGGSDIDVARGCSTDQSGNVFMCGSTLSFNTTSNYIATPGSYQSTIAVASPTDYPEGDAYLVKFNGNGQRQWGTYYGDLGAENSLSCPVDQLGNVFLCGQTNSGTGTVIANASSHQPFYGGAYDNFLVKFNDCVAISSSIANQVNINCFGNANGSATINATGGSGITYTWQPSGGNGNSANSLPVGIYTVNIKNSCGANKTQTVNITQPNQLLLTANTSTTSLCIGNSATLSVGSTGGTGVVSYTWSSSATSSNIIVSPTLTTSYTVTGSDANGCLSNVVITQSVINCGATGQVSFQLSERNVILYPNPVGEKLFVSLNSSLNNGTIELLSIQGKILREQIIDGELMELILSDLSNGFYFVRIKQGESLYSIFKIQKID